MDVLFIGILFHLLLIYSILPLYCFHTKLHSLFPLQVLVNYSVWII